MKSAINILYLLIPSFIFPACTKIDLDNISNLNNGQIDVIGHAGTGFQSLINPYPNNSFESIKHAINGLNADGVEIDIDLSKDSTIVLYHDQTLEKSTNCFGCVNQFNASELENCEYYNQYGAQLLNDVRIIRFTKVLDQFKNINIKPQIYLNLKIASPCITESEERKSEWVNQITQTIQAYQAHKWVYVYDGDTSLLKRFRAADPGINTIYNAQSYGDAIAACTRADIGAFVISNSDITKEQVKDSHSKNIKVIIWGILKRKDVVEAINKSPDALMTDNIPLTQQSLQK